LAFSVKEQTMTDKAEIPQRLIDAQCAFLQNELATTILSTLHEFYFEEDFVGEALEIACIAARETEVDDEVAQKLIHLLGHLSEMVDGWPKVAAETKAVAKQMAELAELIK
jgi:hypothetical protein